MFSLETDPDVVLLEVNPVLFNFECKTFYNLFITFSLSSCSCILGLSNINCTLMIDNYFSPPLLNKESLHINVIPFSISG